MVEIREPGVFLLENLLSFVESSQFSTLHGEKDIEANSNY